MPINSGRKGFAGILGIPGETRPQGNSMARSSVGRRKFRSRNFSTVNPTITGTTRDAAEAPLGDCIVDLFRTADDAFMNTTTSDGAGLFAIAAIGTGPFYLVAYKAGGTDVAGTTVNTLQAD